MLNYDYKISPTKAKRIIKQYDIDGLSKWDMGRRWYNLPNLGKNLIFTIDWMYVKPEEQQAGEELFHIELALRYELYKKQVTIQDKLEEIETRINKRNLLEKDPNNHWGIDINRWESCVSKCSLSHSRNLNDIHDDIHDFLLNNVNDLYTFKLIRTAPKPEELKELTNAIMYQFLVVLDWQDFSYLFTD